jgi:hypothetical protein
MEYIESIPDNLNMYINEFHTSMKAEFEKSISKIYSSEISVYKDVVETIVKLPFIQKIINENKVLKAKIVDLENMNNGVKLEITDKPISKNILDIEKIPFYKDSEEEEDEEKEDEEVTDTESKRYFDTKMESKKDLLYNEKYKHVYGDDGETVWSVERNQYGVNNDNQDSSSPLLAYKEAYVVTRQENVAETKEEEESSADEKEEDEDEEDEVEEEEDDEVEEDEDDEVEEVEEDEDDEVEDDEVEDDEVEEDEDDEDEEETLYNMPTFPSKVSNKPEKEPSADEEELSAYEEELSADEEEPSADEEEPSADEEETSEVFEIEIDDVTYYCDDEENGNIYEDKNGEVGDIVGKIKDGEASFFE